MPEDTDLDTSETEVDHTTKDFRAMLDTANAEKAALAEKNRELESKVAFADAALPDTPQVKFFKQHYAGDLTADAIRQAATDAGFIQTGPTQEHTNTMNLIEETVTGAAPPINPGTEDALLAELRAVTTNDNSVAQINEIMKKYGRPTADDFA